MKHFGYIIDESLSEIYIFDQRSLHFLHANREAIQNCGYSLSELQTMTPLDITLGLSRAQFLDLVQPLIQKNTSKVSFEFTLQRKDKSHYPVDVYLTASFFNKKPVFVAFVYDISEQKHADLELRKSEERFKRLFEDLGDAVYVTQIGDRMGDILEVNAVATKQSGYSRDELLKMNIIRDLAVPDSGTEFSSENSDKQLLSGETVSYIEKKRKKNGEEYWTEIIITPIEFNGIKAGLSINRDVTARKIQEEKLLMALDAAKESDRIKTAFLANMSHELRTPLNAVIGFSSLIDKDTPMEDTVEFAKHINRSGLSLLEIVDGIFDVTLIERGEVNVNKSKKSVMAFLNDVYQAILRRKKNLGSSEVTIEQELKEIDEYTQAFTDFNILKQIFISLLGNALKFTHKGFVRFGVSPSENENELVFYVKDTGIGIPKEKHERIFERFKIGDDTRTRKYSGIGLGLYISSKQVNLLGGKIWLKSEFGKGSTFYFSIPR